MPHFTVDGVRLHYDVAGSGERPLILVHAYPTSRLMWAPQVEAFSRDRRVVAWDVRGFGLSDAPDDANAYSQERSVADLLALIDNLGEGRVDLCGLSMGGNIALNFALAHPERVASLVVSGTGAGSDDAASFARTTNAWADAAARGGIGGFAEAIMAHPVFSEYADRGFEERARLRGLITANSLPGVMHTARQVLARRPTINSLAPRLAKLPVRTLLIIGERDAACVPPARVMIDAIPGARFAAIPETGHFNNLEAPETLNELVRSFLAESFS